MPRLAFWKYRLTTDPGDLMPRALSRRTLIWAGLAACLLLIVGGVVTARVLGARTAQRFDWYLALGDSLTVGVGAARPAEDVRERGDTAGLVTISIGGNDSARLYAPCAFGTVEQCRTLAAEALTATDKDLATILRTIRDTAGPRTQIVVLTYYNPLQNPQCILHSRESLARAVLEGGAPLDLPRGLNAIIRERAAEVGARVADLSDLGAGELTADCLHPTADGHARIAGKVFDVIPS
ncbi:MAG: SGNH/GDSL hydrolase family protein [Chloroflexota bacterium]